MKSQEIQKHIDRIVGTEGMLRIPSWWMHKILSDLIKYCEDNKGASVAIKEYIESQLNLVGKTIEDLGTRLENIESNELFEIGSELPSKPKGNTIYLIPSQNGDGNNVLTEWAYINGVWEQFGEFKADLNLSEYAKKEDIHTPDWYAKEGEEGYIKNKPFGANYKLGVLSDLTQYIEVNTYYDLIFIKENRILASVKNDYVGNITLSSGPPTYCKVEIVTDNSRTYKKLTLINNGNYHNVNNPVYVFASIMPLDERYIPDTVLKISPQSLSNTDKNQVLSNLDIQDKLDKLVNVTYNELVELRNNSQLIAGMQYRITDYITTTTQENTQSAGHPFDVIVTALDSSTLSENACAIQSARDTDGYFADSNLAAWELKYCLDNDTNRFNWADTNKEYTIELPVSDNMRDYIKSYSSSIEVPDTLICKWWDNSRNAPDGCGLDVYEVINMKLVADDLLMIAYPCGQIPQSGVVFPEVITTSYGYSTPGNVLYLNGQPTEWIIDTIPTVFETENGKGVIYRMIDEWNNDCPYDFKNIMYDYSKVTGYVTFSPHWNDKFTATAIISRDVEQDKTINDVEYYAFTQIDGIGPGINIITNPLLSTPTLYSKSFTLSNTDLYIIVDDVVSKTTAKLMKVFSAQYTFGKSGNDNSLTGACKSNVIKRVPNNGVKELPYITFGDNCYNNSLSSDCRYIIFGDNCYNNSLSANGYIYFNKDCYYNTFGHGCASMILGSNCYYNMIGNGCTYTSLGTACSVNTFGNRCGINVFGNYCQNNDLGFSCTSNAFNDYCKHNKLGNGGANNTFGKNSSHNKLGNSCNDNIFGESSNYNILGACCTFNTIGSSCSYNSLGNSCTENVISYNSNNNMLGNNCKYIIFNKYYFENIIVDSGNYNINLNTSATTSPTNRYKNVRICLGVNNTDNYKNITDTNVNQNFETLYRPSNSKTNEI